MKRMVCAVLSGILAIGGIGAGGAVSYGAEPSYAEANAVGPGIKASVGVNDFLDQEVANPIVVAVDKYSYEQMEADIASLQTAYGDKITVNVIGTSLDGRSIYDIILGNPQAETQILMQGAIHAREYMTPLLMMQELEYALAFYDTGHYNYKSISDMLQKVAIHFVPMTNPDGVTLSQFGIDAIRSDALKQGIRDCYDRDVSLGRTSDTFEVYLTKWKANAAGVDLNYNFPYGWEELSTQLIAPSYGTYKGPAPFSEPESKALSALADQYPFAITVSYHSQGEVIYWTTSSNGAEMASNTLAAAVSVMTGYRMDSSDGKGGFKDWMQSRTNAVPGVTLEVGKTPCPVPFSEYPAVWKQNKGVWVQVLDYVVRRI
ncbi:MAG: M14 family metallocarboxypeptidase [Enterocloster asparagiformis]|nr:M14 family metallocarboxypeptidase [Enterocloster asparagiformis]